MRNAVRRLLYSGYSISNWVVATIKPQFIDRRRELEFLESKWREKKPQLLIVYGRRRVGKTMLLKEFLKNKPGAYILFTEDSYQENLEKIKRALAKLTGREYFREMKADLPRLFKYFAEEISDKRVALVFDEFQYFVQLNRGVLSLLQESWDEYLSNTQVYIVLCGSSIGMMESLLSYKNPLYGRRTGQWKVAPFTLIEVAEMFPDKSFEELVKIYAVFGGTPFYLAQVDPLKTIEENIKEKILKKGEVLYEEPEFLLREEFREPKTYKLILKYIALGYTTLGELVNVTGLDRGNLSRYLDTLERLEIIGYKLPMGKKKRGRYYIRDYYIRFWFRYVYPNLSDLELGETDKVFESIRGDLENYYAKVFEEIVLELLEKKILDFGQHSVYTWWHKGEEIDAIAVGENKTVFIEVKWGEVTEREATRILERLREKAEKTGIKGEKEYYLIARKVHGKAKPNVIDFAYLERILRKNRIIQKENKAANQ